MPVFIDLTKEDGKAVSVNTSLVNCFAEETRVVGDGETEGTVIDIDGRVLHVLETREEVSAKIKTALYALATLMRFGR